MKNKLLTKVSNIDDISLSVEYFKEKYYPDILKEVELLESIVEQIKLEPRILYDESYVKGWKDELTLERESLVKIVINLLQSVLNELETAHTLLYSILLLHHPSILFSLLLQMFFHNKKYQLHKFLFLGF